MSSLTSHPLLITLVLFLSLLLPCQQTLTQLSDPLQWEKAFKALDISWNSDGTLNRSITIPMVDPTPYQDSTTPPPIALSQDIKLSPYSAAYVRLYIPLNPPKKRKLPLIVNLHGGDFVLYSASTVIYHNLCNDVAAQLPAVVVSVEYRLAPEHRLPAAYDDALNALFWVRNQSLGIGGRDPWMDYADFSKVFILGSGSGGNIAYHVALRALDFNLSPIRIRGLMMNQPFFGGVGRTPSEIRLKDDPFVALYVCDVLWALALPKGANRDHEFCNPMKGGTYLGRVFRLPAVYIKADYGDPLVDRTVELGGFLARCGVRVYAGIRAGGSHGMELINKTAAQILYGDLKYFVQQSLGDAAGDVSLLASS